MTYNVVVIGAGPGGFDAAIAAAEAGLKTALVEKHLLGGTCLNYGCIPTKMMLGATSAVDELAHQKKAKVADGDVQINYTALQKKKDRYIGATRKAMATRLKTLGIDLFEGTGTVSAKGEVTVTLTDTDAETISAENIILATGAKPTTFPGLEPDGEAIIDSTGFLALEEVPESLIVVGAGFIGLEMAQVAHRLGCKIHVVDALKRVANYEDQEVSKTLSSLFKRWKWDVRTDVRVQSVVSKDGEAVLTLEGGDEIVASKALLAVGRRPVSQGLGLEALGVEPVGPGFVPVNDNLEAADNIYAIGDLNGRMQLAHAASHQAHYVVSRIAGKTDAAYESGPIPSILYGSPEVIRVGELPEQLKEKGKTVSVSKAQLTANPIAQAHAATQGFVKVVWCENKVVGITAVGHHVSGLITAATIMVKEGWTKEDAHKLIFAHPSLDESLLQALTTEAVEV
ncbi:MAG: dihydrolipoyl dehydrogenase family protein [Desulfovibrio sp.]